MFFATVGQEALFIPNEGQWDSAFTHKTPLKYGALFFQEKSIQFVLNDAGQLEDSHGHLMHESGLSYPADPLQIHVLNMEFIGAKGQVAHGEQNTTFTHNYFLGEDQKKWRSGVQPSKMLVYDELYAGTRMTFKTKDARLKYEWALSDVHSIDSIAWMYHGAQAVSIGNEGQLIVETSVGEFYESAPVAWGWLKGERIDLGIRYELSADTIRFKSESLAYDLDSVVIDPTLVFTSFSGSLSDNWGFTATYDDQGRLYGGGINFSSGYVSTVGSFQIGYNSPPPYTTGYVPDITISVFEPNGTTLLYATYLGGSLSDHPHSMVVNSDGELIVMGTTGSTDFPTQNPIQSSNAGGATVNVNGYDFKDSDIFLTRFNASGTAVLSSTYLGGTGNDGINMDVVKNYGDNARGEVVVDASNNIYLTASTNSTNFPTTNCTSCNLAGGQDAVVMKLNSAGTQILWSNYYGSTSNDAGYSIKTFNNSVYICGGTQGNNLPLTTGAYKSAKQGALEDGFVARFNSQLGSLVRSTYVGTSNYDQAFIMDVDKFGNLFVFGQTYGTYPITSGAWGTPQYTKQFIHKISADLATSMASTAFGSPQGTVNLVPTAFNVDDCLNILLSGWGGVTNTVSTSVSQLPVSTDALQSSTNGSDFYFMVLGKNFTTFKYGSYFGGTNSSEHVDGGTSRFDDRGRIYQAACAGCGGNSDLPTTPGAFSVNNNSNNCNLGVIKLDFETGIEAVADIDFDYLIDTTCYELTLRLSNDSENANAYFWDFGQGDTSNLAEPVVTFPNLGTYQVMLVAIDTVCDTYDTTYVTVEHDTAVFPVADWDADYASCDLFREVDFTEQLADADYYEFDFGDGTSLTTVNRNVQHTYPGAGTFVTTITALDSFCAVSSQIVHIISFDDDANIPSVNVTTDSCRYGGVDVFYTNIDSTMIFDWDFSGNADTGLIPSFRYPESGLESVTLTITDTVCNRSYDFDFLADIVRIDGRVFIPSAFTPNDDTKNEVLKIFGNSCLEDPVFIIYNSWGNEVFRSEDPFKVFWDGYIDGVPAPQDVYTYRFTGGDEVYMGSITIIR